MIPAIKRFLVRQDSSLHEKALSIIKLHNGSGLRNHKVSFVVLDGGRPIVFLKSVRFWLDEALVQNAHQALRNVDALSVSGTPKPLWIERIQGVLVCAETLFEGTSLDPANQKDMKDAVEWLTIFAKKTNLSHGDFTPGNILRGSDGKLRIIDWDGYGKIKSPLFDLLTLLTRSKVNPDMQERLIEEYMADLGIEKTLLPSLKAEYEILDKKRKL
ncbi:MAG: phosphotransferase [Patescibacteria group bacterium]|jgi:RIO-like serine/threonine protein kinase